MKTLGGGSGEAGEESREIKKDMQNIRQEGMKSSVNEYTLQGNWNTARVRFVWERYRQTARRRAAPR